MKVGIVGAGVAGCIMARSLARVPGLDVTCLERVAPDDQSEAGTGLNIGPNAVKALTAHDPELAAAITEAAFAWKTWRISLTGGRELFHLPLADVAAHEGWRIRWAELYRVMREAAGDVVRYGCAITGARRTAPGKVGVTYLQGGATHRLEDLDLLIAADGRYSQVRAEMSGAPELKQVGIAIFRLLVPDTSAGLIDDYAQLFNGPNRLLTFRVPPGYVYMAGTFPIDPDRPIPDAAKTVEALRAAYLPASGEPSPAAAWLVRQITTHFDQVHWARMQEHGVLYADPAAPVLYLGDSAHGMVPTLGQGATMAVEDATFAADVIAGAWAAGARDVRACLDTISAIRTPRVRFAMDFSLEASDTMMAGADPVAGTIKKLEPAFLDRLRTLYAAVPVPPAMGAIRAEAAR
ncbi:FAD-dependent oxidoreductase [Azorhizobium doebereinerae]|uniref:FAD-dependent oxidoreductase n=1 Tax=Azorhizobium doebereinerae TaxID=281091 RepID=UPI000425E0B3|nr:NAD(P)/FAD-dependent oxidoreductase [Azorhizobium doebereinerae]